MMMLHEKEQHKDVYIGNAQSYSSSEFKEKSKNDGKVSWLDLLNDDTYQLKDCLHNVKGVTPLINNLISKLDDNLSLKTVYRSLKHKECIEIIQKVREHFKPNNSRSFWRLFQHIIDPELKDIVWGKRPCYTWDTSVKIATEDYDKKEYETVQIMFIQDYIVDIILSNNEQPHLPNQLAVYLTAQQISTNFVEFWALAFQHLMKIS